MPVYEYQCAKCDEKFEAYLRRACAAEAATASRRREDEKVACPKCRAKKVKKLFSVFGIGLPGGNGGG
jgi:predicted nucleic acid-binding Zn ribbon protein